jgi:transposase
MAKPLLPETLWQVIEPILPVQKPSPKGGRPPVGNKETLTGILFVLVTGGPWEYLPQEMGCGSGMTCWRRLRDWQKAGVWHKLHLALLEQLSYADQIDWSRVSVDASSVPAPKGGTPPAPIPPTGAKQAANTISPPTEAAFRWWRNWRQPTKTKQRCSAR